MMTSKLEALAERLGLRSDDLEALKQVFTSHPSVRRVWVFGSRAKGTFRRGSDVDLALEGEGLSPATVRDIAFVLNEETIMPYHFDVLELQTITSPELLAHIERVGVSIYER
jgi:predicted nucleotidyltransferase